jgi:metal-responsive CopG/Arc/MetJ family transcriptional regulator
MATIKTAVSIDEALFDRVDAMANELAIPRSQLFALAVEEYIHHYENQKLLEALNAAYDDSPDPEEEDQLNRMRYKQRDIVEGEW